MEISKMTLKKKKNQKELSDDFPTNKNYVEAFRCIFGKKKNKN